MQATHCKHFNGDHHNATCRAGVAYADVTPDPKRIMGLGLRRPCRNKCFGSNPSESQLAEFAQRGTCGKFELPTAEELAADERKMQAAVDRMMKLTPLISRIKNERKGTNWTGKVECPICAKQLHISHAAYNGHVRGKCETENCVNWIE